MTTTKKCWVVKSNFSFNLATANDFLIPITSCNTFLLPTVIKAIFVESTLVTVSVAITLA